MNEDDSLELGFDEEVDSKDLGFVDADLGLDVEDSLADGFDEDFPDVGFIKEVESLDLPSFFYEPTFFSREVLKFFILAIAFCSWLTL